MTGILTETANLTNSYQYDSYGNLTSGTADGVNYYGYNGESTNVKTGLQYLRARYYNAENGTFTTEDSDLGTTENPLTRNRYDYTTNNPLNYSDPTGHSLWSRIKSTAKKAAKAVKSVGKKIVNTAKKVVKTVVNTAKKAAKTIVNTVKGVAKTAKNAAKHAKQTYQSVKNRVTSSSTYQKITSRGSQFIRSVSNGVQKIGKTYTSFKSYVSERTAEIRSEVVRHMCTTTNRITDKLGKVDWKKVGIAVVATGAAVGIGILTDGVGTLAIGALGLTEGTLGAAIVGGAVTGAIVGATYSGVSSGLSGNSLKQVAKDTLAGGLTGAVTGGVLGGVAYGAGKVIDGIKSLKGLGNEQYAAGDATFMESSDRFVKNISKRKNIDADGYFEVIAHGTPDEIQIVHNGKTIMVDARTAARLIENSEGYNGQPIRLLSCSTGSTENGFA
ncbi:MAG: RHS repeat-associated core domain-containing protein [Dorea sp.]